MAAFHRIERQAFEGMSTRSTEIERQVNCFALDSFTYGNRTEGSRKEGNRRRRTNISRKEAKTQRKPQSIWPSPPMGTDTNSLCSLCLCVLKMPSIALEIGNTETRRTQRKKGGRSEPISHAKEQRHKENRELVCVMLGAVGFAVGG